MKSKKIMIVIVIEVKEELERERHFKCCYSRRLIVMIMHVGSKHRRIFLAMDFGAPNKEWECHGSLEQSYDSEDCLRHG